MSVRLVEIADDSEEGRRIAETLRGRGFRVVERSMNSLGDGSDADALLLAGDVDGVEETLRVLRSLPSTATTPVILLGAPIEEDLSTSALLAIGADGHYPRPVAFERLVRKLETFLAPRGIRLPAASLPSEEVEIPRPVEPTLQLGEASGSGWQVPEGTMDLEDIPAAFWKPPERTLQLDDLKPQPELPSSPPSPEDQASASPTPPPLAASKPLRPAAELSPRLRKLMLDADRRVFPSSAPLDLHFPAGDESARELVPDELLDMVPVAADHIEEDPLEAFTYIGTAPEGVSELGSEPGQPWMSTPSAQSGAGSVEPVPNTPAPVTGARRISAPAPAPAPSPAVLSTSLALTQDDLGIGEPTTGGRGRHGELGDADVLRLLWRIGEMGDDVWIALDLDRAPSIRLRVSAGDLVAFEGPVADRVVEVLRRDGRLGDRPAGEEEATTLLEQAVSAGRIGRFELDRMVRRAREELVFEALDASGGRFELEPVFGGEPGAGAPLLTSSLNALLLEGARRRFSDARVRSLLGGGSRVLSLAPGARVALARLGLEPEVAALVQRLEGASLEEALGSAVPEAGMPGALYAMIVAGIVTLHDGEARDVPTDPVDSVRGALRAAAALAEDADYFAVLGIRSDALPRELHDAYETRTRELTSLNLGALGLEDLEPSRRLALEALTEAYDMLRDERRCAAYRSSLGL